MGLRKNSELDPLRPVIDRALPRDAQGLIAQLRSPEIELRRWAARDLAAHPDTVRALGEQLLQEQDSSVREALFTSLGTMATPDSVSALLPLLRRDDAQLRNRAIEALAGMPRAVAPRITALLGDTDVDVRIFTVNLLGELRHEQVPQWLLMVLANEQEVNVVAAAIDVLAEVGQPEHVAALRATRQRFAQDPFIGFTADMVIARIESP
ncbi:HEAT repeat domain-containing protein [Sphaerotilus montanus]|uniref:HEAT repeat protein n=1 Tax=Sphaerotilus montanus TaxID=522889 RepID=A0A7Y9U6Q3_9BURK|nr:HEAT repeat domain-containing protein [Sphaerotilus montanus]NYG32982.1 HEAT repeat protein [Sphaerotilus montanus]NZD56244.1 HEAT repeat domain-containing protein [Sphaerotilus montanus]